MKCGISMSYALESPNTCWIFVQFMRMSRPTRTRWLYGALGAVPADYMFICDSLSLTPIRRLPVLTVDGGPPDIEAQWWGGPRNPAAKRCRAALVNTGIKVSPSDQKGGWKCYIMNVIKEANIAGEQEVLGHEGRLLQARQWAPLLRWELEQVKPRIIFAVGGNTQRVLGDLRAQNLVPRRPFYAVCHYSDRGKGRTDETVLKDMIEAIQGGYVSRLTPASA